MKGIRTKTLAELTVGKAERESCIDSCRLRNRFILAPTLIQICPCVNQRLFPSVLFQSIRLGGNNFSGRRVTSFHKKSVYLVLPWVKLARSRKTTREGHGRHKMAVVDFFVSRLPECSGSSTARSRHSSLLRGDYQGQRLAQPPTQAPLSLHQIPLGYPCEIHNITTEDGYILTVFRVPHGVKSQRPNTKPVLLQHGFGSSSFA